MNLYVTHYTASDCPQALDDRRLHSSIGQTTMMLSTAAQRHTTDGRLLGPAFVNHPITRWAGNCNHNYAWVADYRKAAITEYRRRFDRHHALDALTPLFDELWFKLPYKPLEPFINFAYSEKHNIDYRDLPVPYSYRNYLNTRWSMNKPQWTRTTPPLWREQ